MPISITQADLKTGLRLVDEEQFPSSEGKTSQYGKHISDLSMIDAKNVLPTLEGYGSFFGVDSKIASTDLPVGVEAQEILGYRTLYGNAILIAFCNDGFYIRSLAGEETAVVTDVAAVGDIPDHYTIDLPSGKGSWIQVMSPILGFLSPWKLWTYALFQNHLYFYAKGFNRIFRLTSYQQDQVVVEQLNPTYIIGTGKAYQFVIHGEENSVYDFFTDSVWTPAVQTFGSDWVWTGTEWTYDGQYGGCDSCARAIIPLGTWDTNFRPTAFIITVRMEGTCDPVDNTWWPKVEIFDSTNGSIGFLRLPNLATHLSTGTFTIPLDFTGMGDIDHIDITPNICTGAGPCVETDRIMHITAMDFTFDKWKQMQFDLSTGYVRGKAKVKLESVGAVYKAPEAFISALDTAAIASSLVINSRTKTDIDATITLSGDGYGISITHDGLPSEFTYSVVETGGNTELTIGGFKENTLTTMNVSMTGCAATSVMAFGTSFNNTPNPAFNFRILDPGTLAWSSSYFSNYQPFPVVPFGTLGMYTPPAHTSDLKNIILPLESDGTYNKPALLLNKGYGKLPWTLLDTTTFNSDVQERNTLVLWDEEEGKWWYVFAKINNALGVWSSTDMDTWVDESLTATIDSSAMTATQIRGLETLTKLRGIYILSTLHPQSTGRNVTCFASADMYNWSPIDDTGFGNLYNQAPDMKFVEINNKIYGSSTYNYYPGGVVSDWVYELNQSTYVLTRLSQRTFTYLKAFKGKLLIFDTSSNTWESSSDGINWTVLSTTTLDIGNNYTVPFLHSGYDDNINTSIHAIVVRAKVSLTGSVEGLFYSLDGITWVSEGDMWPADDFNSWYHTIIAEQFHPNIIPVPSTGSYNINMADAVDSNELLTTLVAGINAAVSCSAPVITANIPATATVDYDITVNLPMINPAIIPSLSLTKNVPTAFSQTGTTTVEDVQLAHMEGITAAKGRLVAWDIDNLIYWGGATEGKILDFTPSQETRANQLQVSSVLGKIIKCEGYANGFIIYSTGNVVRGTYTGGTYTYEFKPIKGIQGIIDPRHVKATLANHYIWTNIGLQQLEPESGQLESIAPELTDWMSNYRYPITLQMLAGRFLVIYLQDRNFQFSNKRIRQGLTNPAIAKIHNAKTVIEFTPVTSGLNLYPIYQRSLVYDTILQRWGSADLEHKLLFAIDAINQVGFKPEKDYSLFSASLDNKQKGLAILNTDNSISLANSYPADSYIVFGKYAMHRDYMTKLTEVIAEFVTYPTAEIEIEKSLDGATLDTTQTVTKTITDLRSKEGFNITGQWLNILIRGHYNLKRLLITGYKYGRR